MDHTLRHGGNPGASMCNQRITVILISQTQETKAQNKRNLPILMHKKVKGDEIIF